MVTEGFMDLGLETCLPQCPGAQRGWDDGVVLMHSQTKVLDLGIWWIPTCYLMNFTIQIVNNTFNTWKLENLNNKKHTWNFEPKHRLVRPGSAGGNVWRWDPGADGKTWWVPIPWVPLDGIRMHWMFVFCQSLYPLVNIQKTMERSTMFNGKIHYFNGHFQ
jgi:hypothetical protein